MSVLVLAALTTCAGIDAQAPLKEAAAGAHVVVISLDGFPARALQDPMLPMPTLRSLAARGASATAMQPINPTVTWPNHTAMITGVDASQHHVMANGLIEFPADHGEPTIEPWVAKEKLVHAHTLYEAATEKGLTTAQVDWVAIYGAKGVTWDFGERPDASGTIAHELVAQGTLTAEQVRHFGDGSSPAWRDEIWTAAAVDIIEKHKPNLLLLHLLQTDTLQHMYAPLTPAAYAAYADADACIARVVDAVREAGLLDRTTFFLVSDHGFASFTHTIHLNVGLEQQGFVHRSGDRYTGPVLMKAEGGAAEIFIPDTTQRATLVPKLKEYFATLPGVAHVYTNAEARAIGLPSEQDTDQAPQLYLTATPDYAFSDESAATLITAHPAEGQHGYLNTDSDMQALFIASGARIRSGVHVGSISNLRVAPTIASVLGVRLDQAQDSPLSEIFQ
ncbi:alkaline phosphatase family protein [Bryocella elongata]|uniref:alkaline phosphatase family protein n=1 Tax=Bryocella elongata TaxID=863522 RepID=UPI000CDE9452|nr:alkaline phosphatase family protein [Bryocella elongata]